MNFSAYVRRSHELKRLVVQPRMGFSQSNDMRDGLLAVYNTSPARVGTITVDSYTRVNDHLSAREALRTGQPLNGYPIVAHGEGGVRALTEGLQGPDFPIQVRHGSAEPEAIFAVIKASGLAATEGGPVSYCLPYGRTPLAKAVDAWARSCDVLAAPAKTAETIHLESFGGCMLGQLCPPSLLIAFSVLECLFFRQHGVFDVSLSYAQQTNFEQDVAALRALRRLAAEFLTDCEWHVVLYTYMGVFPRTADGARDLLAQSARLAFQGRAERLIVKTIAEAHRIPTVKENIEALELAAASWTGEATGRSRPTLGSIEAEQAVYDEALNLISCVLSLSDNIGQALTTSFARGYLDVPFCLHADNRGRSRSYISRTGTLEWHTVGTMPIKCKTARSVDDRLNPHDFLNMLSFVEERFDRLYLRTNYATDSALQIQRV